MGGRTELKGHDKKIKFTKKYIYVFERDKGQRLWRAMITNILNVHGTDKKNCQCFT